MRSANGNLRFNPNLPFSWGRMKTTVYLSMGEYLSRFFTARFHSFRFDRGCHGDAANQLDGRTDVAIVNSLSPQFFTSMDYALP